VQKQLGITYSECAFLASVIQQAKGMRHIILSSVTCPAVQNFSTLSNKQHDLKKIIEHKMCVLILSSFIGNISHSKKN